MTDIADGSSIADTAVSGAAVLSRPLPTAARRVRGPAVAFSAAIPEVWDGLRAVEVELHRLGTSSLLAPINDAVAPIVAAGGKRLRAALTLAAVLGVGGTIDQSVITAAACVELVHAASLVHDDLMDGADERRGVRTVNASRGVGSALLVGDFMLARAAGAALTEVSAPVAEVLGDTVVQLVEGQYLELGDLYTVDRPLDRALDSVRGKTGALFRTSCVVAGLCAGVDRDVVAALGEYGERFGVAFQLLDDLLDLAATAAALGKPVGTDLRHGVYTVPVLRLLDPDRPADPDRPVDAVGLARARALLAERGADLTESDVDAVRKCLRDNGLVADTLDYCAEITATAADALPPMSRPGIAAALRALPVDYLHWAHTLCQEGATPNPSNPATDTSPATAMSPADAATPTNVTVGDLAS